MVRKALVASSMSGKQAEVLEAVMDYAGRLCGCDSACIALLTDGTLRIAASQNWSAGSLDATLDAALELQRPIIVDDALALPLWERAIAFGSTRACVAIPLSQDHDLLGVLCLASRMPGAYSDMDALAFTAIGAYAAIAIINARLSELTTRHESELRLLQRISQLLNTKLDLPDVLEIVLDGTLGLFDGVTTGRVFIYEEGRLSWGIVRDIHSHASRPIEEPEPDSIYYRTARQEERHVIDRGGIARPALASDAALTGVGFAFPLKIGQRVLGVLSIHCDVRISLGLGDLRTLQLIADHTAMAIDNVHYYQRVKRRGTEIAFMQDVLGASTIGQSLDVALAEVASLIRKAVEAAAVALYLPSINAVGASGDYLYAVAVDGVDKQPSELAPIQVGDPNKLVGLVARDQYAEVIDELERQIDYDRLSPLAASGIIIPLTLGDQLQGLIALEFPVGGDPYDFSKVDLLLVLASTLPSIIANLALWAQLSESEKRFRQLAETVHEVFILIDPEFNQVLYVNSAFEKLWSRPVQYLSGGIDSLVATFHPGDQAAVRSKYDSLRYRHQDNPEIECRVIRPDGEQRWVRLRTFGVEGGSGQILRHASLVEDITERKFAEQQAMALRMERQRVELLADFIRNISHDFRTPLATINTSTFLLKRDANPKQLQRIDVIGQQVIRLDQLLESMLTMTRLDQGIDLDLRAVSLNAVLSDLFARSRLAAEARNVNFAIDLSPTESEIAADVTYLDQAFLNLIQNAIAFSPEHSTILLRARAADRRAIIEIHDQGIGISEADLPHIFERFYRVDHARGSESGGVGLGLTVAKKIVELHGGEIVVESALGEGSIFRVLLPLI